MAIDTHKGISTTEYFARHFVVVDTLKLTDEVFDFLQGNAVITNNEVVCARIGALTAFNGDATGIVAIRFEVTSDCLYGLSMASLS